MAMIEDEILDQLQRKAAVADQLEGKAKVLDALGANPKTRRRTLEMLKEINPALSIPEIDAAAPVLDEVKKANDRVAALEKQIQDDKETRAKEDRERSTTGKIEEGRAALRKKGYTDEGIAAVEKLMQDEGIIHYEAAASLLASRTPPEEAVTPTHYGRDMPMVDDQSPNELREAMKLPRGQALKAVDRWSQNEIRKGLAELRGHTR